MKSLILKTSDLTFMVDGISDKNTVGETNTALRMIFKYLEINQEIESYSSFKVFAKNKASMLKNAVIDGLKIKGTIIGEPVIIQIDSIVMLDIRDFKIFDFKRLDPYPYKDDDGEIKVNMSEEIDGDYVKYEDYQLLLQKIVELENK